MTDRPRLLITMGDVAGVGPEIIAKAWPSLNDLCQPVVVGDPDCLRQAVKLVKSKLPHIQLLAGNVATCLRKGDPVVVKE